MRHSRVISKSHHTTSRRNETQGLQWRIMLQLRGHTSAHGATHSEFRILYIPIPSFNTIPGHTGMTERVQLQSTIPPNALPLPLALLESVTPATVAGGGRMLANPMKFRVALRVLHTRRHLPPHTPLQRLHFAQHQSGITLQMRLVTFDVFTWLTVWLINMRTDVIMDLCLKRLRERLRANRPRSATYAPSRYE